MLTFRIVPQAQIGMPETGVSSSGVLLLCLPFSQRLYTVFCTSDDDVARLPMLQFDYSKVWVRGEMFIETIRP
jgi:hypothetical protein